MLDLGALLRVPNVETDMGFDLAPDGERVAFSWNPDGRWEIYEISLRGLPDPQPVSRGPGSKFAPRYSPDGRSLAFAVDFDGGENYHIFLHDFASGRQTNLTPGVQGALQPFFSWSPDGKQIAFISDQGGRFDVYLMPVADGIAGARLFFDAGYPAWKVHWSPDGAWLAVTVEASGADYGMFLVPLTGGEPRRIALEGRPINAKDACWSPDGRWLAFCSDVSDNYQVGVYDLEADAITWLTDGDGQNQYPAWSPDGERLSYVHARGMVTWLALQEPGRPPVLHQVEPGVHYRPHFMPDGGRVLFAFDNPRHPTDLWMLSPEGGFNQLTHSLPAEMVQASFVMPEEVTYPGMDGAPVPALLFRPPGGEPGPGVLLVHGGPDWHFEMIWYPLMAHMAGRGWTVLVPNYRGSTGYGRAWQAASRFDYGGVDARDVAAGVHYLAREKLADPARIAVTGRSHGGYLTACCLTGFPDLWAAGSAVVPFLNWFTNHAEIRPDLRHWDSENFGDPVKDEALWRERSPSFFLDRIRAPLQLIIGRHDARCPVSDSLAAYDTLRELGREVDLVMYEDEGHTFLKIENVIDAEMRRVAFLAKCLEGRAERSGG